METEPSHVAFSGDRRVAEGSLPEVLRELKRRFDRDASETVLVFEVDTGSQVDFDLRGTVEEVIERALPAPRRGPGRPRLGVSSREVTLLPRHWEWLEEQPNGASGTLRRLVEQGMKASPGKDSARKARDALSRFLAAMAGNRPNYEEATRALFAGDAVRFASLVKRWPKDVREHAMSRIGKATGADPQMPAGT